MSDDDKRELLEAMKVIAHTLIYDKDLSTAEAERLMRHAASVAVEEVAKS